MVTRTLPCAVMRKPARLTAGNGTEAGYHACGSLRVTIQPPAAACCPGDLKIVPGRAVMLAANTVSAETVN